MKMGYKVFNYREVTNHFYSFMSATIKRHQSNLSKVDIELICSAFLIDDISEIWKGITELDDNGVLELTLNHFGNLGWELVKIIFYNAVIRRDNASSKTIDKLIFIKIVR